MRGGESTFLQIRMFSVLLLLSSLSLTPLGVAGSVYGVGASILGAITIGLSERSSRSRDRVDVRRVFTFSLLYLPLLFLCFAADLVLPVRSIRVHPPNLRSERK